MPWQDRLFAWVDQQIRQHPGLDGWLERQLHAYGLHGPAARHLLKTRILPDAMLMMAGLLVLLTALVIWRIRRRRVRRRRHAAAVVGAGEQVEAT